jgi:hypothetical protein
MTTDCVTGEFSYRTLRPLAGRCLTVRGTLERNLTEAELGTSCGGEDLDAADHFIEVQPLLHVTSMREGKTR